MRRLILGATLSLALVGLTASPALAASAPAAPTSVSTTQTATSATIKWSPPASDGGSAITGYYVARDGIDANGGGAYSTVKSSTTRSFTFTLLKTGSTYHLTVAARNSAGQSVSVVKTVTPLSPAPKVTVLSVAPLNSLQPYAAYNSTGIGTNQGGYDCTLYYHEVGVTSGCGGATIHLQVTGMDPMAEGTLYAWADTARTFGCIANGVFTTSLVVKETHVNISAYGSYFFSPGLSSWTSTASTMDVVNYDSEAPVNFSCPAGSTKAQKGIKISNITATLTSDRTPTVTAAFAGPWYS